MELQAIKQNYSRVFTPSRQAIPKKYSERWSTPKIYVKIQHEDFIENNMFSQLFP